VGPAVSILHTSQLDDAALATIRQMLGVAYGEDFSHEDWEHTVGGTHALIWEGAELIAHGSVVPRRFLYVPKLGDDWDGARVVQAGYVEGVAVRADRRRLGLGTAVMASLGEVIRREYSLGALSASDDGRGLYEAQGWLSWRGRTFVQAATGIEATPDEDDGIYVLPVEPIDVTGCLACDWRSGDVW
jgi:aminoglycoside 2'-N-acetyltransferase I